jgi:hypothetical protein
MSAANKEWIFLLAFFACFFFVLIAETKWLQIRAAASLRNAAIVAAGSDLFGITAGLLLAFVIFGSVVAFFRGGQQLSGEDPRLSIAFFISLTGPFIALLIPKLILARILRLRPPPGITPYAFVSTFLFLVIVFGIPALIIYLLRSF